MSKDRIYGVPQNPVPPFQFDESVVRVFDDMLTRSIPLYREIIRRQVQLLVRFYQEGTRIYDLGCSNGNLGMGTCRAMGNKPFDMIAVDSSRPMIAAYAARLEGTPYMRRVTLEWGDIRQTTIDQASVVVLNFTLQFIAPEYRDAMVKQIYDGLLPGGVLLLCEKSAHANATIENMQQAMYYQFKKENGYSDLEISQKREALEKVLVPEAMDVHLERCNRAGFRIVDVWLKWFNFAALIAVK